MMLFLVKLLLSHSTQEHTKSLGAFASCLSKPDPFVVALIFTNPAKGIITSCQISWPNPCQILRCSRGMPLSAARFWGKQVSGGTMAWNDMKVHQRGRA